MSCEQCRKECIAVKIYAYNIPLNHPSLEILSRFGEVSNAMEWLNGASNERKGRRPSIIFGRFQSAEELEKVCRRCSERGDWCFAWLNIEMLGSFSEFSFSSLIDFVGERFDREELEVRFNRLMMQTKQNEQSIMGVPDEIAHDLTKKQLIIVKALFEVGEQGLSKSDLAERIWRTTDLDGSRASGFNVHILHLRRKLERFGLMIKYDKQDRVYRVQAAVTQKKSSHSQIPLVRSAQVAH